MRFDYYSATVPASPSHCKAAIISHFGGDLTDEKPVNGFKIGWKSSKSDVRVYHGGQNPLPYLVCSGASTPQGVAFIREVYPEHRVSRADVCHDFVEKGGFERVMDMLDRIARPAGVGVTLIGDPDPLQTSGRTLYYGSPKSDVRLVVYQKGLLERSRGAEDAPEDWFRVELRVRPRKERKSLAAEMSEAQMHGLANWTREAGKMILGFAPEFVPDISLRRSSADAAFTHMLNQYGRTIRTFIDENGRKEAIRRVIQALHDA